MKRAFLFLGSLLLAASTWAQTGNSIISGVVRDATDAPLPGAVVVVANDESGVRQETTSNDSGVYRFGTLVPGSYHLEVSADGFQKTRRGPIVLQVAQSVGIDIQLQVGQQSDTITVTEDAPVLETQTSNVTQTVNRAMLTALPLPNRAAATLASLAPGVVMNQTGAGTAENYPVFTVAGGRVRNQNFILDGGNVTNAAGLTRAMQLTSLPVDAMQEFTVITNNYAAEYGHSTGGVITMSTRSGTNQLHGSLFESLQNNILNARNFFATSRPPIRLNQFGGSLGGPIQKDKTHFFATWERTKQQVSDTQLSTVPTLLNRAGDFSDLRSSTGQPVVIYDPATTSGTLRTPFVSNLIPVTRLDPVAVKALAFYPLPNRVGTSTNANNFGGNTRNRLDRDIFVGRGDHQLTPSDMLTVRYYVNNSGTNDNGTYGIPLSDPLSNITSVRVQSLLGSYTHIFGPSVVNDLRVTYLRRKFLNTRPGYLENPAALIGLAGVSDSAFPAFTVPGYAGLGNATGSYRLQTPILDRQIIDSISYNKGKHAYKFGFEARFARNEEIRDRGSAGNFTLSPLITGLPGRSGTGNALASLLIGEINTASIQISDKIRTTAAYIGAYAQDDWRVTDRLTLNIGLRWETELPRKEVDGKMNSFDPLAINPISGTPGIVTFAGVGGTPSRAYATDKNNIGPRVGFAYRVHGSERTVVRGGAGIFYGSTVSNTIGDTAALGFSTQSSLVASQPDYQSVIQLRNGFPTVTRPALTAGLGAVPFGQKPTTAISFFNPKQVAPISYQYNLSIQNELSRGLLAEVGYIGNVSHHLASNDFSLNQVRPDQIGAGDAQSRRPFPQYSNVTWINPTIGNSTYHAGFVRVERRFAKGFSILAHYTFSKFLDDVSAAEGDEYGTVGSYMDQYNRGLDKGRSGSDVPHRLLLTMTYAVPRVSKNRFVNGAIGGWKVGVLETFQSGAPFTVLNLANIANAFSAGQLRPNILRDATLSGDERSITRWFDTTAFVAPAQYQFGNSPRAGLRGPRSITTDMTVEKGFAINERFKFEIRGEFYNAFNHANFNIPGFTLGGPGFGVISSARAPRTTQLAARLSF
ncbi:MAG: carboxypeptidase regulatory-like domain-containing protein [Bryobacteraceae bacterium]